MRWDIPDKPISKGAYDGGVLAKKGKTDDRKGAKFTERRD
jgi:hypothetical protein